MTEQTEYTLDDLDQGDTTPHLAPVPTYPTGDVPGPLGDLVRAGCAAGLPAALVGGAGLGTAAALCMDSSLEVSGDTWVEPPTLWVPLIAPPGGAKSPSMKLATAPLEALEADAFDSYRAQLADWQALPEKERGERPVEGTRVVDDATLEALARHLDTAKGTAAVISDELRGFLQGIGQYKKGGGSDQGRYLSLWDGSSWRYRRVTSGLSIFVRRPVSPIVGGLQPAYAHLLGPEEDGMRPRWLPHLSLSSDIEPDGPRIPSSWKELAQVLYGTRVGRTRTMDASTRAVWKAAQRDWKARSRSGDVSAAVAAALHKADRQVARIALVLAETLDPVQAGPIPPEAMTGAVAIMEYVLGCWQALPERDTLTLSRTEERVMPAVDKLADWLEQRPNKRASRRDVLRSKVGGIRTADTLSTVLKQYEQLYPGAVKIEESGPKGGKPGVYIYAPRRAPSHTPSPDSEDYPSGRFVDGDKPNRDPNTDPRDNTAGNRGDGPAVQYVDTGNKPGGDKPSVDKPHADSDDNGVTTTTTCQTPGCASQIDLGWFPNGHCHTHQPTAA